MPAPSPAPSHGSYELIPGRYGIVLTRTGDTAVACRLPVLASTRAADGSLRTAAVVMAADLACGLAAGLGVLPRWGVTADSAVEFVGRCRVGPLRVDAWCVRPGRHQALVEFRAVDEGADGAPVAVGTANHGVREPTFEPFLASMPVGAVHPFPRPADAGGSTSLEGQFGIEVGPEGVRAPLDVRTANPWGIFHGGLYGLLVLDALASAGLGEPTGLSLRFLHAVREGPVLARVDEILDRSGVAGGRVARITVGDEGRGRVALVAHAAVGPGGRRDGDGPGG